MVFYDYNIRGWLTGINKSYLGSSTNTNYFGMELGYDKSTATPAGTTYKGLQYNGNIAGTIWKSAGDGVNRQYDFSYDNVNRLTGADFNQQFGATWTKQSPSNPSFTMDFSVGNLTYDANGNIKSMKQSGFKIGGSGPIDELKYNYKSIGNSNRLAAVYDSSNDVASKLGDFHFTGTKNPTDTLDYTYDGNGNLISDNNKGISSITYNYLNLPTKVSFSSYRYIYYTYDDAGNKLMKVSTDGSVSPNQRLETRYISGLVYLNDTLSYIPTEEGRARWAFHRYLNGSIAYKYEYDFAEKDHLGNTRVMLSQEKDTAQYMATMEAAPLRTKERALFYNIDSCSYATSLVPGGYPTDNTTTPNDSVARVNGTLHKMGPAILLKMMSGDSVSFGVKSFYRSGGTVGSPNSSLTSVLNALAGGLVTMTGASHGALTDLTNPAMTPVYNEISNFLTTNDQVLPGKPKSYLNWMMLDNQFNYVSSGGQSGVMAIGAPDVLNPLTGHFKLKNSGYLYIWVSNETPNWDVFFDNLSIQTFTGPMLEENHYYPFGLSMAGISDKALKTQYAQNKYRYSGKELQNQEFADGSGLEEYDFGARTLDPQLGVWHGIDPLADQNRRWSPYNYAMDNPIRFIDPDGMDSEDSQDDGDRIVNYVDLQDKAGKITRVWDYADNKDADGNEPLTGFSIGDHASLVENNNDNESGDPKKARENIVSTAEKHINESTWAKDKVKDNIPAGSWKCSKFVYDILKEAGIDMGLPKGNWIFGGKYPYSAGDWGNPDVKIPGWEIVKTPEPGDVAAYKADYTDASGHVGIYTGEGKGVWANATTVRHDYISNEVWKTDQRIIYRRYVGSNSVPFTDYYIQNPYH